MCQTRRLWKQMWGEDRDRQIEMKRVETARLLIVRLRVRPDACPSSCALSLSAGNLPHHKSQTHHCSYTQTHIHKIRLKLWLWFLCENNVCSVLEVVFCPHTWAFVCCWDKITKNVFKNNSEHIFREPKVLINMTERTVKIRFLKEKLFLFWSAAKK